MNMEEIHVVHLIPSSDETLFAEQSQRLRQLRLDSLRLNPDSFSSKYVNEINQPTDFWYRRLRNPDAQHWVATTSDHGDDQIDGTAWVGFLVFVKQPLENPPLIQPHIPEGESPVFENYYMSAAYVDFDHRGRGVCTSLIKTAIQWVTDQARDAQQSAVYISTRVRLENASAKRLYESLGFKLVVEDFITNNNGERLPSFFLQLAIIL